MQRLGKLWDRAIEYFDPLGGCQSARRGGLCSRLLPKLPCRLCGAGGEHSSALCSGCRADLPTIDGACRRCAIPLPAPLTECGPCLSAPPPFDAAKAAVRYAYPADWLVRRFKFAGELALGRTLAAEMTAAAGLAWAEGATLAPVPLHPRRRLERGYDQAAELARRLGKAARLPVRGRLLARARATSPQTGLSAPERRRNVSRAFVVREASCPEVVCLVDDVMTTGSTAAAAAAALRAAGAQRVLVWTFARAEAPES